MLRHWRCFFSLLNRINWRLAAGTAVPSSRRPSKLCWSVRTVTSIPSCALTWSSFPVNRPIGRITSNSTSCPSEAGRQRCPVIWRRRIVSTAPILRRILGVKPSLNVQTPASWLIRLSPLRIPPHPANRRFLRPRPRSKSTSRKSSTGLDVISTVTALCCRCPLQKPSSPTGRPGIFSITGYPDSGIWKFIIFLLKFQLWRGINSGLHPVRERSADRYCGSVAGRCGCGGRSVSFRFIGPVGRGVQFTSATDASTAFAAAGSDTVGQFDELGRRQK